MKKKSFDISLSKNWGADVYAQDRLEAELPYLQWEIIYISDETGNAEKEYILYDANDEMSEEKYENTNLCPGEIDEINLVDENMVEVDDAESWVEEQIDLLLKKKLDVVRAILKERLLKGKVIEAESEPKRSFAWSRSLAGIAHILEKENCLPKGSVVFRKKGEILNLRSKLSLLYGEK